MITFLLSFGLTFAGSLVGAAVTFFALREVSEQKGGSMTSTESKVNPINEYWKSCLARALQMFPDSPGEVALCAAKMAGLGAALADWDNDDHACLDAFSDAYEYATYEAGKDD